MRITVILIAGLLMVLSACRQDAGPLLSDPRDILTRTIGATSLIRTATVRVDASMRMVQPDPGGLPAQPQDQGGTAEALVDLANGEFTATLAAADGSSRFSVILADGAAFTQDTMTGRWVKMPMAGGLGGFGPGAVFGVPGGIDPPNVPAMLAEVLADPTTTIELRGVEDCAAGRCYRLAVGLAPERVFKLVVTATGMDQMPGFDEQAALAGGFIPGLGVEVVSDTATLRMIEASVSASVQGTAVAVRLQLSRFDEPVAIQPPPPALVDNFGLMEQQILEGVGEPIEQSPAP
jgi:hypothetical protein